MNNIESLCSEWVSAKQKELEAVAERRRIEDLITKALDLGEDFEGTETIGDGKNSVKVIGRIRTKIDDGALQEIAAENGMTSYLSTLFRWKPEINAKEWADADDSIKKAFSQAFISYAARPSFTMKKGDSSA